MLKTHYKNISKALLLAVPLFVATSVKADDMDDVQTLLEAYIETESDLTAQGRMMTDDRTYIVGAPAMRDTDNVANMELQLFQEQRRLAMDPDGLYRASAEDFIIKVYGDAAVASFRRNLIWRPSAEGMRNGGSNNTNRQWVTVMMAKVGREWKIVHTHISPA